MWIGDISGAKCKDELYKTSSAMLCESLRRYIKPSEGIKEKYNIYVSVMHEKAIEVEVDMPDGYKLLINSNIVPDKSITKSVDTQAIISAFSKTSDEAFSFNVEAKVARGLYVSMANLNELRRMVVAKIKDYILAKYKRKKDSIRTISSIEKTHTYSQKRNLLYVYNFKNNTDYSLRYEKKYNSKLDIIYLNFKDVLKFENYIFKNLKNVDIYIVISNFNLFNLSKLITLNLERLIKKGIKGVVIGDLGYLSLCKELKKKYNITLVADYTINTINCFTAKLLKENLIDRIAVNIEASEAQIHEISKVCDIELVEDLATAMTSRYCILGSFLSTSDSKKCSRPCLAGNYTLLDTFGKAYNILCDNTDCVMKLVRNKVKYSQEIQSRYTVRNCML